ncbi:meprin A subunit beta isoform X3 [Pangasianodon hypophthalmus]|uniref:meprin A subunit beta isoform X2 n=1 Tax=Pangasianodon hypophthalmus TaxID=310915 RepID=UPI002307FD50|nr:meprin A subunit beta isoform X2 [Pangasianodon hypophthalmus]XP_053089090.1 meprin A subunit beta isoform X3 [Pangasianodon hypophthalmus]
MDHSAALWTFLIFSITLLSLGVRALPTSKVTEYDVDGGKEDLFEVNQAAGLELFEGDILYDEKQGRNSIIGDEYLWPTTVPYYLEDDLDINAKGVIMKAFEQYRLKTCIDYKPWSGEENYISVFQGNGCYSYVGNRHVGKQSLSIGAGCDRIATIEHEFLHALGFWHEQSRADRDDYVTIMWDRIQEGREHNFNKYDDTTSSSLNVPYDYGSMMHYSKNAFSNGTEPTIVTKIPAFSDVIGQRMEFSDSDLLKLNRLYNCTRATTFLDTCDFELENICGMIQGQGDKADWEHVTKATGGPDTDYSNMGRCTGTGYFMHFSTISGTEGDTALLESRLLYPNRNYQCLQFFYYHSGNPNDKLEIWVREYNEINPSGTLRMIETITGLPEPLWQLHHVNLDVSTKFRVVFKGTKGAGSSTGGLSLDDINLSETACPEHVWRIKNFKSIMENTPRDTPIYSPRFQSKYGYTFQMSLYPSGTTTSPDNLGAFAHLTSGDDMIDGNLTWPCPWMQITMMLMDQNADIRKRMSNQRSITTDPNVKLTESSMYTWDNPRKVGAQVTDVDGTKYFRGPGYGTSGYLTQARALSRDFIKGGDAIFLLSMEDISNLLLSQPLPSTTVPTTPTHDLCASVKCENDGVCVIDNGVKAACRCVVGNDWWYYGDRCQFKSSNQDGVVTAVVSSVVVFVVMVVVTVVSVVCLKKKYKKKMNDMGAGITTQNVHTAS